MSSQKAATVFLIISLEKGHTTVIFYAVGHAADGDGGSEYTCVNPGGAALDGGCPSPVTDGNCREAAGWKWGARAGAKLLNARLLVLF